MKKHTPQLCGVCFQYAPCGARFQRVQVPIPPVVGRIRSEGVMRFGHTWMVPKDAKNPLILERKRIQKMEVGKSDIFILLSATTVFQKRRKNATFHSLPFHRRYRHWSGNWFFICWKEKNANLHLPLQGNISIKKSGVDR